MMPPRVEEQFTQAQLADIIQAYQSGETQAQIAKRFGVPRRTIMKLCIRLGLHKSHSEAQPSRFADGFVEEVGRLRSEGKTVHQIAAITKRSTSAVSRAIGKSGVEKPRPAIETVPIEDIVNDYNSGMNLDAVGNKYGTTAWMVRKRLVDHGYVLRDPLLPRSGAKRKNVKIELPLFEDSRDWFYNAYIVCKYSAPQIASFINRSSGYVTSKLGKYNIPMRGLAESIAIFDHTLVVSAYKELGSLQKVAERFGASLQGIKNILLANGITPTSTSEMMSGAGNPFYGKRHSPETAEFCRSIGSSEGKRFWLDHPEYAEVARARAAEYWSDIQRRYEDSKRISELRASGKCMAHKGALQTRFGIIAFDSSYERQFIKHCESDNRVVLLERDFDIIEYEFGGPRHFVPDFRIWLPSGSFLIVEVKSDWYAKQPKEREKIMAGFGQFSDRFMVISGAKDLPSFTSRLDAATEAIDFDFSDVVINVIGPDIYTGFYGSYHYLGKTGRTGYTVGAFVDRILVAAATFGPITRAEMAEKQGLTQSDVRELVRFCIHPDYHKKNFASWFLGRAVAMFRDENKNIKMLISFADSSQHYGTLYKAANWVYDGDTKPSYHYVDTNGLILHKKTIYDRAKASGKTEATYAFMEHLVRIPESKKLRFILRLS